MQITGMLYGSKLLRFVAFPTSELLGPDNGEEQVKALIERHGSVFIKPVFKGGVGKKGKAEPAGARQRSAGRVREGLDDGHHFNCGVVYLAPSAARDGVGELDSPEPGVAQGVHRHRKNIGARRP